MIAPSHPFARATWDLLMVMHDRQLPAPMSLHWSDWSHRLAVQVQPRDFLRWLDALSDLSERTATPVRGRTHYKATGVLRGAPQTAIRLSAVSDLQAVA